MVTRLGGELETGRLGRDRQRLLRHLPEIGVPARERTQPRILELPGSPSLHERSATSGKDLLRPGRHHSWIDDRKPVEGDGLERMSGLRTGEGD
jgi:hypothetical protein